MFPNIFSRLFRRTPPGPYQLPVSAEYLSLALEDGRKIIDKQFGALTLRHHRIADLQLPSGRLVGCDPFVNPGDEPYNMILPTGTFPVTLSVAEYDSDQRVAFAVVQFKQSLPVTWKMMATGKKDPSTLKPGQQFGYAVDSATGCFMDRAAGEALEQKMSKDENFFKVMMAEMEKNYRHTWDWMDMRFGEANLVAFKSGFGDGAYATYAGYSMDGKIAVVVTEFAVVPETPA